MTEKKGNKKHENRDFLFTCQYVSFMVFRSIYDQWLLWETLTINIILASPQSLEARQESKNQHIHIFIKTYGSLSGPWPPKPCNFKKSSSNWNINRNCKMHLTLDFVHQSIPQPSNSLCQLECHHEECLSINLSPSQIPSDPFVLIWKDRINCRRKM